MRLAAAALAISMACDSALAQPSVPKREASRVLVVSWYTRTLPTTDVDLLIDAGPPPQIPKHALSELTADEQARMALARRNGSVFQGLVWYDSPSEFAAAYMDPITGAVSMPWEPLVNEGLSALPVGSATCGQTTNFVWNSESGNLIVMGPSEMHPALASRLRHLEFMIAMDQSPEEAFAAFITRIGVEGKTEKSESDGRNVLTWRSVDKPLSVVLRLSRPGIHAASWDFYSWTMTAIDSVRQLATITTAEVRPVKTISLDLPATSDDLSSVYEGMAGMSLFLGGSLGVSDSQRGLLDVARMVFGVGLFVAVFYVLLVRKEYHAVSAQHTSGSK